LGDVLTVVPESTIKIRLPTPVLCSRIPDEKTCITLDIKKIMRGNLRKHDERKTGQKLTCINDLLWWSIIVHTINSQSNFHCDKVNSKSATRLFYRSFSNLFWFSKLDYLYFTAVKVILKTNCFVCPFAFGHCVVCSSIYGFWLPFWYLLTPEQIYIELHVPNVHLDRPFRVSRVVPAPLVTPVVLI
jgi:hypothetical protein